MCKLPLLHGFAMTSPLARGGLIDFRVRQIPKARYRRACKGTGVQHIGTDWQSVRNKRDSKAGDPALPHRITIWMSLHWVTHYFPALRISTVILHVFLYASSAPAFFHLSLRWYPHIPLAPE